LKNKADIAAQEETRFASFLSLRVFLVVGPYCCSVSTKKIWVFIARLSGI